MRKKRSSPSGLEKAVQRLAGLKSISPDLDFGGKLTIEKYEGDIKALQDKVSHYNTLLSEIDMLQSHIKMMESELREISERMLTGVATRYGKDSDEYLKAGGTKKSERKPYKRKLPLQ